MGAQDTHRLGYGRIGDDPNGSVLLATMDATKGWDAARRSREWERDQLRLGDGQRLLDVGCGLGDAALTLAQELGDDGELVGIDASTEMPALPAGGLATRRVPSGSRPATPAHSRSRTTTSMSSGASARCSGSPTRSRQ